MKQTEKKWYAIYVRHNTEFKVEELLKAQNIEVYLPTQERHKEKNNKIVKSQRVIIGRMLFVRIHNWEMSIIEHTSNVNRFFTTRGKTSPEVIPEKEMEEFRFMVDLSEDQVQMIYDEQVPKGTHVSVIKGELAGIQGELVKYENKYHIVVRLQSLGCALVSVPISYIRRNPTSSRKQTQKTS